VGGNGLEPSTFAIQLLVKAGYIFKQFDYKN